MYEKMDKNYSDDLSSLLLLAKCKSEQPKVLIMGDVSDAISTRLVENHFETIRCSEILPAQEYQFDIILSSYASLETQEWAAQFSKIVTDKNPLYIWMVGTYGKIPLIKATLVSLLNELGYLQDLELPGSVDCFMRRSVNGTSTESNQTLIHNYEVEKSRLRQLAHNQRELLFEYREQLAEEAMRSEQFKTQIVDWQIRWDAFWNSRTGKLLLLLQRMREKFLPRGGMVEKTIKVPVLTFKVIKREGLIYFISSIPRRLAFRIRRSSVRFSFRFLQKNQLGKVIDIESVHTRPDCITHDQLVDIIICVHNALDDVQRCLESVELHTCRPYRAIIVDDGSEPDTEIFLSKYAQEKGALLLRNEKATGYTRAANLGIRSSEAGYIVLLNSDTIVTSQWLDKMICCAQSDPQIGIVGPLSNTASWQSIPKIEEDGDWAENPLPSEMSVEQWAESISQYSERLYPEMPLLNGFCLLIKKDLISEIGLFDEENFGAGYGEEDDFALRSRKAGWKLALADNTYIYHAQSKSYSSERRKQLSARAGKILRSKHGEDIIQESVQICHQSRLMEGIRARAANYAERMDCVTAGENYRGRSLLFLLPIATPGGGANVIRTEALAMKRMGVEVGFFNFPTNKTSFEASYPIFEFPVRYGEIEDIPSIVGKYDAVIATYNPSVDWMRQVFQVAGKPLRAYYVQGFEPLMYPDNSSDYFRAKESYTLFNDLVCFTKTEWTRKMVFDHTGQQCKVVGVSLDVDLYRPRHQITIDWPIRPVRIAAMVRPEAAYREPQKTMELLNQAANEFEGRVEICIFGTQPNNPDFLSLPHNFGWNLYGVLPPEKVANLLSTTDIFVDYSSHQAMGLTALEAMSCGNAVIVPSNGGAVDFARHEYNSLVVDTTNFERVWMALKRLVEDTSLRAMLQKNAIYDVCQYYPEKTALKILEAIFGEA